MTRRRRTYFPGRTWVGSQLKSGVGFHGREPSSDVWSPPPGQRLRWSVDAAAWNASSRSSGGTGVSWPSTSANALAWTPTREAAPSAS